MRALGEQCIKKRHHDIMMPFFNSIIVGNYYFILQDFLNQYPFSRLQSLYIANKRTELFKFGDL